MERIALDFADKVLDSNLEEYKRRKARSRSSTPTRDTHPGSPWGNDPAAPAATETMNESASTDVEPSIAEVVKGHKAGAQWPKPGGKTSAKAAAADPRVIIISALQRRKRNLRRSSIVPNSVKG